MKNQSATTQVTIVLLLFCLLSTSFIDNPTYIKEIETWHKERMASLKSEDGWLNLAGLIWLEVGKNTFGSSEKNKVVFPKGKSEQFLGDLTLQNGEVFLNVNPKAQILNNNLPVKQQIKVFPYEKPNEPTVLAHQSLRWIIIKRGDKFGVRLRDLENTNVKEFKGVDTFPIDENWRVEAKLEPATDKKIPITDVLGITNLQSSPGTLVFKINGQ